MIPTESSNENSSLQIIRVRTYLSYFLISHSPLYRDKYTDFYYKHNRTQQSQTSLLNQTSEN